MGLQNSDRKFPTTQSADITFFNKHSAETKFINGSIPGDSRISQKLVEKWDRYRDLSVIISRLLNTSTFVVPVIVGALI